MNIISGLIKFITPVFLAVAGFVVDENKSLIFTCAVVAGFYAAYAVISDSSFRNQVTSRLTLYKGLLSNLKKSHNKHKKNPHVIATAVIDLHSIPPFQIESHNVIDIIDIIDCGVGDFKILVNTPFNSHLIPRVESSCQHTPSVSINSVNDLTCVNVKWNGVEPEKMFFSLVSGEGYV